MTFRFTERAVRDWLLSAFLILLPTASFAQTQTNYITLEWTAPGDDGTAGQAYQYEMRYSTADPLNATDTLSWWNGANPVPSLPFPSYSGATDSVRVQGLTAGVTYYFVLKARDEVTPPNWSGYSNIASAQPRTCVIPDQTPQGFTVIDDNGDALLSWSGVPDASATALHVYRGTGSTGALSLLTSLSPSATSYRDNSIGFGTYRYQVRWVSDCGNGPATSPVPITFSAPPTPTEPAAAVQARPNPSSGPVSFVLTVPGSGSSIVSLRLFDSTGRLIAIVADGAYSSGNTVSWPRTSSSGDRVGPGYYELIGTIGTTRVRERLVLLP